MKHLDLELTDSEGDPFFVRVYADGTTAWTWQLCLLPVTEPRCFSADDWLQSKLRHPCIPLVLAAFAALKEQTNE